MIENKFVYGAAKISNLKPKPAKELIHAIYELGVREIDTAPSYENSEKIIGGLIHDFPDFKVNTKIGLNKQHTITPISIQESINTSLEILGLSKINTLFVHSVPSHLISDEVMSTLYELKKQKLCDAIAYSGDGVDLRNQITKDKSTFDTFMFTYNFLDCANTKVMNLYKTKSEVYIKRVLGNSVWRKRTTKDVLKDLLGRTRGHDEYRKRMSQLYPRGLKNGYAASLDFVRYEFPLAKYVIGISNLKQCKDLNRYLGNHSVPDRTVMELMKQVYQDRAGEVEFPPVT